jgi:hypothetical protein
LATGHFPRIESMISASIRAKLILITSLIRLAMCSW